MKGTLKKIYYSIFLLVAIILWTSPVVHAAEKFDRQVRTWAEDCRNDVVARFEQAMKSGKLTQAQIFDTFYVPIPNTYPQKYHTQYDKFTDDNFQSLLDNYLRKNRRLIYFVIVDKNGYVPTHNSKYSHKVTGNKELDTKLNRTKTIFSDRTGISAARNTESYLLQKYYRDNGETVYDLSVPVYIRDQHWGCIRVGYN